MTTSWHNDAKHSGVVGRSPDVRGSGALFSLASAAAIAAMVGCGGGASMPLPSASASAAPPTVVLLYPAAGAYGATTFFRQFIFAEQGLDPSFVLRISATPASQSPAPTFTPLALNFRPTALPSGLPALPTPNAQGTFALVSATVGSYNFAPVTSYALTVASPTQSVNAGAFQTDCGFPPPVPGPFYFLAAPAPGATGVPVGIGRVIIGGFVAFFGGTALTLAPGGAATPLPPAAVVAAASPLPSPLATPSNASGTFPFLQAVIAPLTPQTTYQAGVQYNDWAPSPPACMQIVTVRLGQFST